ncbi:26S proteasome non-ATPase regulatory subunit 8-like protein [Leptotrombidium deliense]|uniref:26S proteasome non-ATPase regulatory subunit 8 n=1 Tax=Leptotrombidium deliense TaxID=299467 RepID=A0A443SPR1_9ACAR|nr:26S proteasome non-ATPase regulatory subunit 8-like protein [Leptotrombidium deliense]
MAASNKEIEAAHSLLKKTWNSKPVNVDRCYELLNKLKVALASTSFFPTSNESVDKTHSYMIRDILEIGVQISVLKDDTSSFERYMAQLKCYYFDFKDVLPPSSYEYQLLGLNLLYLLAQNKVADFHTELELLPPIEIIKNIYISHPVSLEQWLMEGSYNKVFLAKDNVPAESYTYFINKLLHTIRKEIAACMEKAYERISIDEATRILFLTSSKELKDFIVKEKLQWSSEGNFLKFSSKANVTEHVNRIPAEKLAERAIETGGLRKLRKAKGNAVAFGSERSKTHVLLHPLVAQNEETRKLVTDIINVLIALESTEKLDKKLLENNEIKKHLTPRYPRDVILVFGGRALELEFVNPEAVVEAYDHRLERWKNVNISDPCGPRDHHQVVVHEDNVYIIGGHQGPFNVFNSCRKFNLKTKIWSEISPMIEKRAFMAAVGTMKYVYAIGGYNGSWRVKTVERYDTVLNQWSLVENMHERRSGAGAAVLDNKIYVVGGFRDLNYLNSAECYSPESNQWTLISAMSKPRSSPSVVAYQNQIYAIGGLCCNGLMASAERFDTELGKWFPIEDEMKEKKCGAAAIVLDAKIFVIGGWNGVGGLRTVEIWSNKTRKWVLGSRLLKRRTGCAACVACKVPNIEEFTFNERESVVEDVLVKRMNGVHFNSQEDTDSGQTSTIHGANIDRNVLSAVGGINNNQQMAHNLDEWLDVD